MINRKDIAPGTKVYTARRGLLARHDILFTVDEDIVQKRTSCGYKVEHRQYVHGRLLLDSEHYVSTSKEEVTAALLCDANEQIRILQAQIDRMQHVKVELRAGLE